MQTPPIGRPLTLSAICCMYALPNISTLLKELKGRAIPDPSNLPAEAKPTKMTDVAAESTVA